MHRNLFLTSLLIFITILTKSQIYIKFNKDISLEKLGGNKGDTTIFSKDEVYQTLKMSPQKGQYRFFFNIGKDTFNVGESVDTVDKNEIKFDKYDFRRRKNKDSSVLKVDSLLLEKIKSNTVFYIRVNNEKKIFSTDYDTLVLGTNREVKSFSFIAPNTPTAYYEFNLLKADSENPKPVVISIRDSSWLESLSSWNYIVISAVLLGILFLIVWWFFIKKKVRIVNDKVLAKYMGGSLEKFAEQHGTTRTKLISLNQVVPDDYESKSVEDKKRIQDEIRGQELTVRHTTPIFTPSDSEELFEEDDESNGIKPQKRDVISKSTQVNDLYKSNELLQNKVKELQEEVKKIEGEKIKFETKNSELNQHLNTVTSKKDIFENEIIFFKGKFSEANYLVAYCISTLHYLQFCNKIVEEADNYLRTLSKEPNIPSSVFILPLNFYNSVDSILVGSWVQTLQDVKDTGITVNKRIKDSFKQLDDNEEAKIKQFKKLLFEMLIPYSSSILVLSEAMSKIGYFQVKHSSINDIETSFKAKVLELVDSANKINIELKYVPLFTDYKDHFGKIESDDNERSLPYQEIQIEKDFIVEITSYGVKTDFTDTYTRIIRA